MKAPATIQFLLHNEIDKVQWDNCIKESANALIYHYSFYLDAMAPDWNAIIAADYSCVLPITHKKKYGINYLYQPAFTQQLGVVAKAGMEFPINEFISTLQQRYQFWEVQWNNEIAAGLTLPIEIKNATNFVIDLTKGYKPIAANYSKDLHRNLKRAQRFNYVYSDVNDFSSSIQLYKTYYGERIPQVKDEDYKAFEKICLYASQHQQLFCRQITYKNETLAIALLLFDGKRLYNMMNTTTPAGRKTEANHFLLDSIIKEFSDKPVVFDFEGSDLPGVKAFYQNFGPINEGYLMVKYNNLPWPLSWLKK